MPSAILIPHHYEEYHSDENISLGIVLTSKVMHESHKYTLTGTQNAI